MLAAGPRPKSARPSAGPDGRTGGGWSGSVGAGGADTMSVEDMAGFLVEAFGKCRKVRQGGVRPGVSARKDKTHGAALAQGRADASHGAACADGKGRAAKDLSHSASAGERREAESAAGPRDRAAQDAATDLLFDDDNMGEELDLFEQYDYGRPREALSPVVPPPSAHPGVGSKEKEPGERAYPPPTYLFNPKVRAPSCSPARARAPDPAHRDVDISDADQCGRSGRTGLLKPPARRQHLPTTSCKRGGRLHPLSPLGAAPPSSRGRCRGARTRVPQRVNFRQSSLALPQTSRAPRQVSTRAHAHKRLIICSCLFFDTSAPCSALRLLGSVHSTFKPPTGVTRE